MNFNAQHTNKQHYIILDGLRGIAALSVVWRHIWQVSGSFGVLLHSVLAVDFFFMLSGFVICAAYEVDLRSGRLSPLVYSLKRLLRLYPMAICGALLGLGAYTLGANESFRGKGWLGFLSSLSLVPLSDKETVGRSSLFALNDPAWSLMFEVIGSIIFGLAIRWISSTYVIASIVAVSLVGLFWSAFHYSGLRAGYAFDNWPGGIPRFVFPFLAGVLLFRLQNSPHHISLNLGFPVLAALMLLIFAVPPYHWWMPEYDLVCDLVLFPLIIIAGSFRKSSERWNVTCKFLGDLSYPLYIVHFPIVLLTVDIARRFDVNKGVAAAAAIVLSVVVAWTALQIYDEPIRAWLGRLLPRRKTLPAASAA